MLFREIRNTLQTVLQIAAVHTIFHSGRPRQMQVVTSSSFRSRSVIDGWMEKRSFLSIIFFFHHMFTSEGCVCVWCSICRSVESRAQESVGPFHTVVIGQEGVADPRVLVHANREKERPPSF